MSKETFLKVGIAIAIIALAGLLVFFIRVKPLQPAEEEVAVEELVEEEVVEESVSAEEVSEESVEKPVSPEAVE
jgi:hypothetical protein